MTLKRYNGSSFETVPFRVYDGTNWRGTPIYRYNGSEWVDAYLDEGLVAYYPFDGDVNDYSGNGNDGTDNTSAGFGSGRIGSDSKDFDGTDDNVTAPDDTVYDFAYNEAFTVSVWFQTSNTGQQDPIGKRDHNNNQEGWELETADDIRFLIGDGSNIIRRIVSDDPVDGTWHHVAVSYDGSVDVSGITINLDGGSTTTSSTTNGSLGSGVQNAAKLHIGSRNNNTNYYSGLMDDVRIYSRELSSTEINHLYQHGRVI